MCGQSILNIITDEVVRVAKESLGDKLESVILYGSYARGDQTDESDIDVIILANISAEDSGRERRKIRELLNYIDLEYDVLLSISVTDSITFNKYMRVEPFYQNVVRDGVILSA